MNFSILEKGAEQAWAAGAARGGPEWVDECTSGLFYSILRSKERIHNADPVDRSPVLQVFREQDIAAGFSSAVQDHASQNEI
jgi:hypothetical protein